jgi:hypothetical protein
VLNASTSEGRKVLLVEAPKIGVGSTTVHQRSRIPITREFLGFILRSIVANACLGAQFWF